jgi:hypothetical protein
VRPFSSALRFYQQLFYTYGPLFGLLLAVGFAGLIRHWRKLGGPGLLPWAVAMSLWVFPIAVTDFDYRYLLPVVPLASLAAALAFAPVKQPSSVTSWLRPWPFREWLSRSGARA